MLSAAFDSMGGVGVQQSMSALGAMSNNNNVSSLSTGAPFDQGTDTLWVFLLELLSAPQSYGHVICWTDYSQAEFKLYKPAEVASLWGRRKNRPAMNYDKLSRSLRYYYKKNILRKVPGRKYVYQFCRLDQLLASLNPLNSPIASAYCQIFSQHLVANLYNNPQQLQQQQQSSFGGAFPSVAHHTGAPTAAAMLSHLRQPPMTQQGSLPLYGNFTNAMAPSCNQFGAIEAASASHPSTTHSNTPVSFKSSNNNEGGYVRRPVACAVKAASSQPLTPSDDEGSLSCDEDANDIDIEDGSAAGDRFDPNNPAFHVSPQTAFATYAALDGNSQPESIIQRNHTPPISQITPSASGSEGRTPSIFSSAGEPPSKQEKLSNLSSSPVTSSPTSSTSCTSTTSSIAPLQAGVTSVRAIDLAPIQQQPSSGNNIADRRALKRKPEPLKFAFSAANLATSSVQQPLSSSTEQSDRLQQQYALLNTLNSLQSALSPFTARTFSAFNPLSASLATPQTTDWLKMNSPRPDAPTAQQISTFTFPPPLAQFAPLGIPAPLPSPMIQTPFIDSAGFASAFTFPSLPNSANVHSFLAAAHLASTYVNSAQNSLTGSSASTGSSLSTKSSSSSQLDCNNH